MLVLRLRKSLIHVFLESDYKTSQGLLQVYTISQVPNNRDDSEDIYIYIYPILTATSIILPLLSITLCAYLDSLMKGGKADLHPNDIRVSGFGGWVLLRLPLHDHVLPLNIEAPSREDAVKFGLEVAAAVKEFPALDTSALDKFVQPQYAERRSLSAFGLCSSGCRLFRDELTCLT
ncbi:hypothetical protein QQP08_005055 [Theobroma cacao]|nr:hypothetical protein QQP08_005055 [Theobroma cacao]